VLEAFIVRYKDTFFAQLARARIEEMKKQQVDSLKPIASAEGPTAIAPGAQSSPALKRGWLGVKIQSITKDLAESYGVKENTGALVATVTPNSPAAEAGIQNGDLILRFDGKEVTFMRELQQLVTQTPAGKEVEVELLRRGQRVTLKLAVGRLTEEHEPIKVAAQEAPKKVVGLSLAPLTDELRTKHNLGRALKGLIVLEIDPSSPAAERGVKVGDVIVKVAQDAATSLDDIVKSVDKVKKAGHKAVLLRLERKEGPWFVALPVQ
jgi:serine protease Do